MSVVSNVTPGSGIGSSVDSNFQSTLQSIDGKKPFKVAQGPVWSPVPAQVSPASGASSNAPASPLSASAPTPTISAHDVPPDIAQSTAAPATSSTPPAEPHGLPTDADPTPVAPALSVPASSAPASAAMVSAIAISASDAVPTSGGEPLDVDIALGSDGSAAAETILPQGPMAAEPLQTAQAVAKYDAALSAIEKTAAAEISPSSNSQSQTTVTAAASVDDAIVKSDLSAQALIPDVTLSGYTD